MIVNNKSIIRKIVIFYMCIVAFRLIFQPIIWHTDWLATLLQVLSELLVINIYIVLDTYLTKIQEKRSLILWLAVIHLMDLIISFLSISLQGNPIIFFSFALLVFVEAVMDFIVGIRLKEDNNSLISKMGWAFIIYAIANTSLMFINFFIRSIITLPYWISMVMVALSPLFELYLFFSIQRIFTDKSNNKETLLK